MTKTFEIVYRDPAELIPYEMNAKKHDEQQIRDLAAAIKKRGFDQPITVDKDDVTGGAVGGGGGHGVPLGVFFRCFWLLALMQHALAAINFDDSWR